MQQKQRSSSLMFPGGSAATMAALAVLTLTAGGLALTLEKPSFATFAFPGEAAETAQS